MSDPTVYTVERILNKRNHHGVTQYLLKWKDYPIKESTWEPVENILDRGLLAAYEEQSRKSDRSSSSNILNSSGTSNTSSSHASRSSQRTKITKRGRGRPRKDPTEQRQEQLRLQRAIEAQQRQKIHTGITTTTNVTRASITTPPASNTTSSSSTTSTTTNRTKKTVDKKGPQLVVFNPAGNQASQAIVEEIVYEPELTKEPILVTDVTLDDLTVTISECRTPEGFFRT